VIVPVVIALLMAAVATIPLAFIVAASYLILLFFSASSFTISSRCCPSSAGSG
jgi:hypothetical protein